MAARRGTPPAPGGHGLQLKRSPHRPLHFPHQRSLLRRRARSMRQEPTQTEWMLWQELRCRKLGVSFRRHVVLQGYIVDFYCAEAQLILEVDGGWHHGRERKDARRQQRLRDAGYRVLRVGGRDVELRLAAVVELVRQALR